MATTARKPKRLSDEDLARVLELAKQSDSVELKLTVPESSQRSTVAALELDPLEAQIRQVFFFDTPDLALNEAGVVVRARRVQGKGDDSVVKLRPVVPDELPDEPAQVTEPRRSRSTRCPAATSARPSLKGKLDAAAVRDAPSAGEHPIRKLFSKEQRAFFAEHAPEGRRARRALAVLGPIFVLKLKFRPAGARPAARRRAVALPGRLADPRALDEVHARRGVPGRGRGAGVPRPAKGVDLSGEQQTKTKTALEFFSQELEAKD